MEEVPLIRRAVRGSRVTIKNNRLTLIALAVLAGCFFCWLQIDRSAFNYAEAWEGDNKDSFGIERKSLASVNNKFSFLVTKIKKEEQSNCDLEGDAGYVNEKLLNMVKGYPIEQMVPFLGNYDDQVVGMVIGIAKKESDWGKHVPKKYGQDCYNYWGYKGSASLGSALGYSCFGSPDEAVETVARRIEELVINKGLNTPSKMIVWKCGSSCAGHDPAGVRKWISDVNQYFRRIAS